MHRLYKILFCSAVCLFLVSGCALLEQSAQLPPRPWVSVIVKSTQSTFWKTVQSGVKAAANEYNLQYTFEGPLSEEDAETQNKMINDAVARGAKAIVISAIDAEALKPTLENAMQAGVKVIVIDSNVEAKGISVRVGTDNYAAGQAAAKELLEAQPETKCIGMVGFDVRTENGQARERGFVDAIEKDGRAQIVEQIHSPSDSAQVQSATRGMLRRQPKLDAIVTFNEITTLGVGHAIEEMKCKERVHVVGFDNNVVSVGMLESGEIDTLIVQNPFAMGYLCMTNAAMLLNNKPILEPEITTEIRAIRRDNMYSEENQRFLFNFTENT